MKRINFNQHWSFQKHGADHWQTVDLPHDAMIHEPRDPESATGSAGAHFPGGKYVYEKTFDVPAEWQQKTVSFEFGGVYRNAKVYLNGEEAGERAYGYSRFFVCADNLLQYGKENTIRVIADNSQVPNSRWYSGSGIYRPVHLHVANQIHISPDGVKVSTLSYEPATVLVETSANGGNISVEIRDGEQVIAAGSGASVEFTLEGARLWSAESPNLYQCRVSLTENGEMVDEASVSFGIRLVEWSAKQGLWVNGKEVLLRGGCVHHDNGILGACAFDKAEERRVRVLKEAGFNAIRSSHNPTSVAMLEACDRLGMYVMDETFDMWYTHKTKYDYAADFEQWYQDDMKAMVDKDFNHPSVIMYSIGNEVTEPHEERGIELTRKMVELLHKLDRNRAVTGGINLMLIHLAKRGIGVFREEKPSKKKKKQRASGSLFFNLMISLIGPQMNRMANTDKADQATSPCLDALDIAGYNYASSRYSKEGSKHPDRVVVGAETFCQDIAKNWEMVKQYPYLIGDFMWTSWDYLGEASLGVWAYDNSMMQKPYPWLIAGSGAIDILGNVDAAARYAAVVWGLADKPYIGVRPVNRAGQRVTKAIWRGTNAIDSWAWKDCAGNKAEIEVFSEGHSAELFVNGKSLGKKTLKEFKAMWKTRYEPGSVEAVVYDANGVRLSENELVSATGRTSIALIPEDSAVKAGELAYVNVHLVGENGVVESNDDRKLTVSVEGGSLLAFGSANPNSPESFDSGSYTTYYGKALAVVRADGAEKVVVRVSGEGLEAQEVVIPVQ
ncbi:MAG: DUF4982 domain-containing protein [Anaerolineaceae bacterium]|nr:DUF4982 domain-containing protein [Anaerolineaceae bacterium]